MPNLIGRVVVEVFDSGELRVLSENVCGPFCVVSILENGASAFKRQMAQAEAQSQPRVTAAPAGFDPSKIGVG